MAEGRTEEQTERHARRREERQQERDALLQQLRQAGWNVGEKGQPRLG